MFRVLFFFWAATDPASRWHKKIEILPGNVSDRPYYYTVAVAAERGSLPLLRAVNRFIAEFSSSRERRDIEMRWQGEAYAGTIGYRDENADLIGEAELARLVGSTEVAEAA